MFVKQCHAERYVSTGLFCSRTFTVSNA